MISVAARAQCELGHRFFSTVPSVKYSQCVDEARGASESVRHGPGVFRMVDCADGVHG